MYTHACMNTHACTRTHVWRLVRRGAAGPRPLPLGCRATVRGPAAPRRAKSPHVAEATLGAAHLRRMALQVAGCGLRVACSAAQGCRAKAVTGLQADTHGAAHLHARLATEEYQLACMQSG